MKDEEYFQRFINDMDFLKMDDETAFVMGKGTVYDRAFAVAKKERRCIGGFVITEREQRGLTAIWHMKRQIWPEKKAKTHDEATEPVRHANQGSKKVKGLVSEAPRSKSEDEPDLLPAD